jgi:protocatechuate 3,4-dioxygenase beta subunit
MRNYNCNFYLKEVLVRGNVCYKSGKPVKNAIVYLEAFLPYKCYRCKIKYYKKYCGYTITNRNGRFYFLIHDTRYYYRIKVFDNKCKNVSSVSCSINLN